MKTINIIKTSAKVISAALVACWIYTGVAKTADGTPMPTSAGAYYAAHAANVKIAAAR